jgi:hypothetical protein
LQAAVYGIHCANDLRIVLIKSIRRKLIGILFVQDAVITGEANGKQPNCRNYKFLVHCHVILNSIQILAVRIQPEVRK